MSNLSLDQEKRGEREEGEIPRTGIVEEEVAMEDMARRDWRDVAKIAPCTQKCARDSDQQENGFKQFLNSASRCPTFRELFRIT